jgi:polyisoprenyl-phosphate glycosyltransferase
MSGHQKLCLLTSVYNDWRAFSLLIEDIEKTFANQAITLDVLVVNDGSTAQYPPELENYRTATVIRSISVLDMRANVGHQFAIATGLRYAAEHSDAEAVLVMDADGEDRVEDARRLIEASKDRPNTIVVGHRTKRSESLAFRFFYVLYRMIFRVLTGKNISFGNFSFVPKSLLHSVTSRPELSHHYAATILRTRLPLALVATTRGRRYAGQSQMSMPALVFHAVAAFSVFFDVLFSRLLIAAAFTGIACTVGITVVTALRLFTDLAFPNWATTVVAFLVLLATQAILLILCSGFLLLMGRSLMLLTSLDSSRIHFPVRNIVKPSSSET